MLNPAKEDVSRKANEGPPADPLSVSLPEKADHQREKDDSGEDQVNNKDKIPGKTMLKKR